jgi:ATP-dependent metalloprotease
VALLFLNTSPSAYRENAFSQAAIQASKEKAAHVELKHFEWAKDRIIMGAERKSQFIDPKARLATAYHEVRLPISRERTKWLILTAPHREAMLLWLCIPMVPCHCIKLLVSRVDTLWVMSVAFSFPISRETSYLGFYHQTSMLPEDDRQSVSFKQYLAGIDVSMGGRVAEGLSMYNAPVSRRWDFSNVCVCVNSLW